MIWILFVLLVVVCLFVVVLNLNPPPLPDHNNTPYRLDL